MRQSDDEAVARATGVTLVLLDVDGVLTDGRIYLGANGEDLRAFHVRDGLGIRLGQRAGLRFGIVSGRTADVVAGRAAELDIEEVHQGVRDKRACLDSLTSRLGIEAVSTCFVGDDLIDVPAMRACGFAAAPSDAVREARDAAQLVTKSPGGAGAVREVIEFLLRSSGRWDRITEGILEGG